MAAMTDEDRLLGRNARYYLTTYLYCRHCGARSTNIVGRAPAVSVTDALLHQQWHQLTPLCRRHHDQAAV